MKTTAFFFSLALLGACTAKTGPDTATSNQPVTEPLIEKAIEPVAEEMEQDSKAAEEVKVVEKVAPAKESLAVKPVRIKSLKVELIGPKWRMTELLSKKVEKKPEPYYMNFEQENQFTAYAGCNSYAGSYKVKGSKITFNDVMGTKKACDDMKEETYLNEVLRTVDAYKIVDGELQLMQNNKVVARFI